MVKKQKVRMKKECITGYPIGLWDFEGDLDGIISKLNKIKKENDRYKEISFEIETGYDSTYFTLYGYREETDKEKKKRLEITKKRLESRKKKMVVKNKKKEEQELKELKRLMNKFKDKLGEE